MRDKKFLTFDSNSYYYLSISKFILFGMTCNGATGENMVGSKVNETLK